MKIIIGGPPGAGKSTVAREVARRLGYRFYSSGGFFRDLAKEKGFDVNDFQEYAKQHPEIDDMVDNKTKELGEKEDNFVLEGHIGVFFVEDAESGGQTAAPLARKFLVGYFGVEEEKEEQSAER